MNNVNTSTSWGLRNFKFALAALGVSLALVGCAGNPPVDQMATTESAINAAMTAGGSEYAPTELKLAQDKQSQARIELSNKNYEKAKVLAQEAEWDARVAERRSQAIKAEKALGVTAKAVDSRPAYRR